MKKTFLFILFLTASLALSAQSHSVRGSLADSKDNNAVPYVNCVLLHAADSSFAYGTTTGDKGAFLFRNVDNGQYLLRITYIGYEPLWQALDIASDIDLGRLTLTKTAAVLDAVTITAAKPLYSVDGEKQLYNVTEDPSVQTGTASDVLQNAPGVEVDAEGNITLRGSSNVTIWINDQPSHMNAEALKQYIKQLPANSVERVEVITNPSARYSTSGSVINIITSRKIKHNELLCLGVRASSRPSVSPWASYVYSNEKIDFNLYLNADYTRNKMSNDGTTTLFDDNGDTSRYMAYSNDASSSNRGGYTGFSLDWNIDSMTSLSTWLGFFPYWTSTESESHYSHIEYPSMTDMGYNAKTIDARQRIAGGHTGAWFEHRFDTTGRKVSLSLSSYMNSSGENGALARDYNNPLLADLTRRFDSRYTYRAGDLSVDYTHPFGHGIELEAGVEMSFENTKNHSYADTLDAAGTYVDERPRSTESHGNSYDLEEYVTLLKRFGQFTAKAGLRGSQAWGHHEFRRRDGSDFTTADADFLGLVPSLHLSYTTEDFQSYSLNFTRRFVTPEPTQLTTFRTFSDNSYSTGNPALLPSYSYNVEAAWSKYIQKFGNIGVNTFFRANTDEVGTMALAGYAPEYFDSLLVNYTMPVNIGSSHTEGFEANITYRPTAFINVRLRTSLSNYAYNYNDSCYNKLSWSVRLNVWAKLWNRLEVFANAGYSSPQLGLYSISVPNKRFDFGVSSDLFDRRMSVYINVNDIFGFSEWGNNTTAPQYQTTGSQRFDSRFVSLGITCRLGKMELENKARQGGDSNAPTGSMN